ncbi:MAG: GntR family transcriptional regulator [Alphaproteobacteria bacterium]|nr:GntR family transcriptional regulator [Alphaproteobacteria bacterium]
MSLDPLPQQRETLAEAVYARLVEAICDGALAPGEPLIQERLAERLQVSRQPVLQALAMLRRDGFVEPGDTRGSRVARLAPEMVADVYQLRGALDRLAAGAAAARMNDPGRRAEAEAALAATLAEGEAACADAAAPRTDGAAARLVAADVAFHQTLYRLSGNPLIEEAAARPWRHIRRAMAMALRDGAHAETVWREHRAIAEAVLSGDADAAQRAAEAHVTRAAEEMRRPLGAADPAAAE